MTDPIDIIAPGVRQAPQNARITDSIARHESERGAREAALGRDVDLNTSTAWRIGPGEHSTTVGVQKYSGPSLDNYKMA